MSSSCGQNNDIFTEFYEWQKNIHTTSILLFSNEINTDNQVILNMVIDEELEFRLLCPADYPNNEDHFYVESSDSHLRLWTNALNEFLLDSPSRLSLNEVLNKAVVLYTLDRKDSNQYSDDDDSMGSSEADACNEPMTFTDEDDSAFTTDWDLKVARQKKKWEQKEKELRESMQNDIVGASDKDPLQQAGQKRVQAQQIFTNSAASGVLKNDLIQIMEHEQKIGLRAIAIEDNIYKWSVQLFNFQPGSQLASDLLEVKKRFGYDHIEMELDFAIDLYPFYPPLLNMVRPCLQASMLQRVTNMEMLKLSYWNPAKSMQSILVEIKNFLQTWARLDFGNLRNDPQKYPFGSHMDIEHVLLRLAIVSEVNPRANSAYQVTVERVPEIRPTADKTKKKKNKDEYWASGVGYGHKNRPEWDIKAYLAAQQEKDKQIETVLHKILSQLKSLYANHAPQLRPRNAQPTVFPGSDQSVVDPVEAMFTILESSALIPFIEQQLGADSFLEICRHLSVYKVMLDIIREIAMQRQLLILLSSLENQHLSIYALLQKLEKKARILVQHVRKAGNGSIPKPKKTTTSHKSPSSKAKCVKLHDFLSAPEEVASTSVLPTSSPSFEDEERLAREFLALFRDVDDAFHRANINPCLLDMDLGNNLSSHNSLDSSLQDINLIDDFASLEKNYKKHMRELQFSSSNIESTHHYYKEYHKSNSPSQNLVFRVAQEISSLSTSLPLETSSSIFVRSDDEKLVLLRALITGPEGTPYSGGCFLFDIFFPNDYPVSPPMVNLQTTGGGSVRFNPNLYNCGKVCLSLLGTWEGQQGEQWNNASTVLQVLVSIQSLILVPEPYFNEPGYETEIGTDVGKKHSNEYNLDVKINNIKHAMIAQINSPSPGFEDVIKSHFYLKQKKILQELEGWLRLNSSSKLERAVNSLKTELAALEMPANLKNVSATNSSSDSTEV